MIYDCFTFFNELDLLEIRLHTLAPVVDRFVIAEATRTHTGRPKELLFEKHHARYAAFVDKITYIVVDDLLPEEDVAKDTFNLPWINENRQRNALVKGLAGATDDDVIMVSDLDEIPRPEKVAEAAALARRGEIVRFKIRLFSYFVNFRSFRDPWWLLGTQMLSAGAFRRGAVFDGFVCDRFTQASENSGATVNKIRFLRPTHVLPDAGWHFGYLGGIEAIKTKLRASSHYEVQQVIDKAESRLKAGENLFGGKRDSFAVPIDETLPRFLLENRKRFSHLFFEVDDAYLRRTAWPRRIATLRGVCYRFCARLVPSFLVGPISKVMMKIHMR